MRGDTLKRHLKKHNNPEGEGKEDKITNRTYKQIHGYLKVSDDALKMKMVEDNNDFERKIELGFKARNIMNENNNLKMEAMSKEIQEAIELYDKHGRNMKMKEIIWRGWQQELRKHLDEKCDRRVIWVIGEKGNEGKSYFQENIREEYGYARVCTMELSENSRNTFHILRQLYTHDTDIFLFNLPRGQYMDSGNYKILESVKDGSAIAGKYNSKKLVFKKPNILIVFSNWAPNKSKLSLDRWKIFKISRDLEHLDEIGKLPWSEKNKEKINYTSLDDDHGDVHSDFDE